MLLYFIIIPKLIIHVHSIFQRIISRKAFVGRYYALHGAPDLTSVLVAGVARNGARVNFAFDVFGFLVPSLPKLDSHKPLTLSQAFLSFCQALAT